MTNLAEEYRRKQRLSLILCSQNTISTGDGLDADNTGNCYFNQENLRRTNAEDISQRVWPRQVFRR